MESTTGHSLAQWLDLLSAQLQQLIQNLQKYHVQDIPLVERDLYIHFGQGRIDLQAWFHLP